MRKIKLFDLSLTLAAFAALLFLLPPDREPAATSESLQTPAQQATTATANDGQQISAPRLLIQMAPIVVTKSV